jgi:ribosomal protein L7Ae-like RNA K-turn-binding protein
VIKHLGLAYKAHKVRLGSDLAIVSMQKSQAKLILLASDASERTQKTIRDKSSYYGIELIDTYSTEALSSTLGRTNIKVVTITDEGFKRLIKSNKGSDTYAKNNQKQESKE